MNLTPPPSEIKQNPAVPAKEFTVDAYQKQRNAGICLHAPITSMFLLLLGESREK